MVSRVSLGLLVCLVLLPVPCVGWLGFRALRSLEEADADVHWNGVRARLAADLRTWGRRAGASTPVWVSAAAPVEPDAATVGIEQAHPWLDHPARLRASTALAQGDDVAALDVLSRVFVAPSSVVRVGAHLMAARVMRAAGDVAAAARLEDVAREVELDPAVNVRWRDVHVACSRGDPTPLHTWLDDVEGRAVDAVELALIADATLGDGESEDASSPPPVVETVHGRLARRLRWPQRRAEAGTLLDDSDDDVAVILSPVDATWAVRRADGWWLRDAPDLRSWLAAWRDADGVALGEEGVERGALPDGVALVGAAAPTAFVGDSATSRTAGARGWLLAGLGLYALLGLGTVGLAAHHQRQVQALAEARGDLIAEVTHELRTPLTVLRMYAETLRGGRVSGDARDEYLRTIQDETQRLAGLVDRVAEAGRDEPQVPAERRWIDPHVVVGDAMVVLRESATSRGAELRYLPSEADVVVAADTEELRRVVELLTDNALQYAGDAGPIEVWSRVDGSVWSMGVKDHGPGIPERERARVFERWVRGRDATSRGIRGAGMGLWLARRTATSLGGTLTLRFPGVGTEAVWTVPCRRPEESSS